MQQQQQHKSGWPIGHRKMLSPSDRRMLHDISDNLSHLRRTQQRPATSPSPQTSNVTMRNGFVQNGGQTPSLVMKARTDGSGNLAEMESPTSAQNGIGPATVERAPSGSRNDYHKKAMDLIRQDLQDFHVQAQQSPNSPASMYGAGSSGVVSSRDNSSRQDPLRQLPSVCPDRSADKVWEDAEVLSNRAAQNGLPVSFMRLNVPAAPDNKVLRQNTREKYRTQSPSTGSDNATNTGSSRSDSPVVVAWDGPMCVMPAGPQNSYVDSSVSSFAISTGIASSGNSSGGSASDQTVSYGGVTFASKAMPANTRILANSVAQPIVARSRNTGLVNSRPVSGPPVQLTARSGQYSVISSNGVIPASGGILQVANAISIHSVQPGIAVAPSDRLASSGAGSLPYSSVSVALTASGSGNYSLSSTRPSPAVAWSTRQPAIVMQQVTSCEVEWPSAQKATVPPRANREGTPDVGVYGMRSHQNVEMHGGSSYSIGDSSNLLPATVVSTLVTFSGQTDSWVSTRAIINQSPLSQTSSGSSTPSTTNSTDISPPSLPPPDKPPPPYPGRAPVNHPPALRPVPPVPNMATTNGTSLAVEAGSNGCQLIESPKPVRRAEACRKDAERSETRVRHYSPHAFRFFMEQHVENVIKMYSQRLTRRNQLEAEMNHCALPVHLQGQIRRMLAQKESNYLRLRRARIDRSMFDRVKTLGTGAFGQVDLVVKRDSGILFALKTLRKRDVLRRNQVAHVKAERDILAEADNEWVVKLYYSFQDQANLYFVMDYIPGGDLMGLLIREGIFTDEMAQFYIAELVLAIESVHAMGFIHRDIKPDNILIDKHGHIRLTDFGLCTGFRWTHDSKYYQNGNHPRQDSMEPEGGWSELEIASDHGVSLQGTSSFTTQDLMRPLVRRRLKHERKFAHSLVGTPNYIAPEVLARSGYTSCCDWWSVGVILYEMRVGQPPFLAQTPAETQRKVLNWQHMLHIPPEASLSDETIDLIQRLCCAADTRLGRAPGGAADLKRHPFFAGIEFESLRQRRAPFIPLLRYPTDTSNFDSADPDDQLPRRSASLDSLHIAGGPGGVGPAVSSSCERNPYAFLEFTFRRFFDDNGQAHVTRFDSGDGESPIYV